MSSVLLVQSQPSQNRASGFNLNRPKFVLGSPLKDIHSSLCASRCVHLSQPRHGTVPRAQSWVCVVEIFGQLGDYMVRAHQGTLREFLKMERKLQVASPTSAILQSKPDLWGGMPPGSTFRTSAISADEEFPLPHSGESEGLSSLTDPL